MIWTLLVYSGLAAQSPVAKIKDLSRDGKHERAVAQCERLLGKTPDDQPLREACADAAWRLVDEESREALDAFSALWHDTTAGARAHRAAAALTLVEAGEQEDRLRDLVARYPETLAAQEALRRLTHADFIAARDAGDAQSMAMFLTLHPDASHGVMAQNILNTRRFDEAAAWDSVEAWQAFLDSWPDHPRFDEARGRLADATFAAATTPQALYDFGMTWPDHPKAIEALEGALPLLITVAHRDSDLEVATRTLDTLTVQAPEDVTLSLWVADVPVAELCADAPDATWAEGELRFPFGQCLQDGDPVRYVIRASAGPAWLDFELWVQQVRQDPTLDLALRFGPVGPLKSGCESPGTCSPTGLVFGAAGSLLAGVQGPQGDAEVAWWPVPDPGQGLDAPVAALGRWRGPLADVSALGLSPDGTRLAVGFCSEELATLYLVDIASDRILGTRDGLCAQDLRFAPGGRALAVVARDHLAVIDGQTGVTREELPSEWTPQLATWSLDGERLAWWSQDDQQGRVSLWAGGETVQLAAVSADQLPAHELALTVDDDRACLLRADGYSCWSASTGRPVRTADLAAVRGGAPDAPAGPATMAANVDLIAVGLPQGGVALVDGRTGELLVTLAGAQGPVSALALTSDGTRLAAVDSTGAVVLWAAR